MGRFFSVFTVVFTCGVLALAVSGCTNSGTPKEKKMDKMEGKASDKMEGKMESKMEGKMEPKMEGKMTDGKMETK